MRCLFILFGWAVVSCTSEPEPTAGSRGGECRIGPEACNEGLTCRQGACRPTTDEDEVASVSVKFKLQERQLPADGQAKLVVLLTATTGQKAKPFKGKLRLFPSPSKAGLVRWIPDEGDLPEPTPVAEIQFDRDGSAVAEYVSCNRAKLGPSDCPEFVFLSLARTGEDASLMPIARSESIKLTGEQFNPETALDPALCGRPGVFVVVPNPNAGEENAGGATGSVDVGGADMANDSVGGISASAGGNAESGGGNDPSTGGMSAIGDEPASSVTDDPSDGTEDDGPLVDDALLLIAGDLTINLTKNEMSIVGPGVNITMRLDLMAGGANKRIISTRDAVVKSGESLEFAAPCNEPTALVWSGFFDVQAVEFEGPKLTGLKGYFELVCATDTNEVILIQGCILVEEKVAPMVMSGGVMASDDQNMAGGSVAGGAMEANADPADAARADDENDASTANESSSNDDESEASDNTGGSTAASNEPAMAGASSDTGGGAMSSDSANDRPMGGMSP
ncbi:MAG: hypothetical protein VX589_18795 [Myxococcota bacterium]|nr:hypothetical protein [Myxococcota bacterium]